MNPFRSAHLKCTIYRSSIRARMITHNSIQIILVMEFNSVNFWLVFSSFSSFWGVWATLISVWFTVILEKAYWTRYFLYLMLILFPTSLVMTCFAFLFNYWKKRIFSEQSSTGHNADDNVNV